MGRDMRLVPLLTGWMKNGMAGLGVLSPSSQKKCKVEKETG